MESTSRPFAVVTGASKGIGEHYARALARKQYDLLLVARDRQRLEQIAGELMRAEHVQAKAEVLDLAETGAAFRLFAAARRCRDYTDVLIHNAGFGFHGAFADMPMAQVQQMLQLHVAGVVESTRLFLPEMIHRGTGAIINVSSVSGFFATPLLAEYSATKGFLIAFSEAVAQEVRPYGIRVQVCCPGVTDTDYHGAPGNTTRKRAQSPTLVANISLAALNRDKVIITTDWKGWFQLSVFRSVPRLLRETVRLVYTRLRSIRASWSRLK
ncbi:SDR family NAD(P)-dependent oxidoreductase [Nitrospira sp. Nam74]